MTTYIAAYDTEGEGCLAAVRKLVPLHEKHEMPATFFIVARLVDGPQGDEFRALLADHPLFEIASHSYTHMLLRQVRLSPPPGPPEAYPREILQSKRRLEDHFGCAVTGFRTPWGSSHGLRDRSDLLELVDRAGYRYVSTLLWGPQDTMPGLLVEPFTYADDGFPNIREIPACGWHENVTKPTGMPGGWGPQPLQAYPHPMPEANLSKLLESPQEEFKLDRVFIDKAVDDRMTNVSLVWHPWSLDRFDPDMTMVDLVFRYVRERGLPTATYARFAESLG